MSNLIIPGQGLKDPVQERIEQKKREEAAADLSAEAIEKRAEEARQREQQAFADATLKTFKGIYSRHEIVAKAKVGLARVQEAQRDDG